MKVRWTAGSIRFRISPTELGQLRDGGNVAVAITLPGGGGWHAAIGIRLATAIRAEGANVHLALSTEDFARLAAPDSEGVYFEEVYGDKPLRYYVEKDFPCAHPGAAAAKEPPGETFAPPSGFMERRSTT